MIKQRHGIVTFLVLTLSLGGCRKVIDHPLPPGQHVLFVVNGGSETIGLYWPDSGRYEPDVLTTGNTPNFMIEYEGRLYLVNSGFQGTPSIQVIDPVQMVVEQTWPLPIGSNPMELAISNISPPLAWVTSWTRNQVYKLDAQTGTLMDSVTVGHSLDGILWFNQKLYVVSTNYDQQNWQGDTGTLYVLDPDHLTVLDSLTLGYNPMHIATDGHSLFIIGGDAFAGFGTVWKIDPTTLSIVATQDLPGGPGDLVIQDTVVYVVGWSMPLVLLRTTDLAILREVDLTDVLPTEAGVMGVEVSHDQINHSVYLAASNWMGPNAVLIYDVPADSVVQVVQTGDGVGTQFLREVWLP